MVHSYGDHALKTERDITDHWRERLAVVCTQMQIDHAALAISDRGLSISVEYTRACSLHGEPRRQYAVLCTAKLFTSTVIALLVLQRKLAFGSLVNELLHENSRAAVLHGVSVAHLLSHTHGLGCIDLVAASTDTVGFIDTESVVSALRESGRIFAPGKFFSYGAPGYILLGCVIEQVTQKPFGKVLQEEILTRLAYDTYLSRPDYYENGETAICPSSGKGLTLPLDQLLAFTTSFVAPEPNALTLPEPLLAEIFATQQKLPGWSPIFAGCGYGWKDFAHGWHGHNGIDNEHLMYVRINRTRQTAICLVATGRNPGALPSLLLRTAYPALCFSTAMQPRIVNEPTPDSHHAIVGSFGRGHLSFHISSQHDRLFVEITTTGTSHKVIAHQCYLRAAEELIYFLEKPWQNITFLQLVTDENMRRYLWDHSQLWPELIERD